MSTSFVELGEIAALMRAEQLPERLIASFGDQYSRYRRGERGKVDWASVEAPLPEDLVPYESLSPPSPERTRELLAQLVCIKLNGGLGTTMKLDSAKSLIPVRGEASFLDLIANHMRCLGARHGLTLPLLLMNSFRTREESLASLAALGQQDLPLDFLQHRVPRIDVATGRPVALPAESQWSPPGHGDIYLAMLLSGLLQTLVDRGYRWAFVSNADNLGATVDLAIVDYLEQNEVQIAMEVTPKTAADRKGGTLIRQGGRLALLERVQVPEAQVSEFEDIDRFTVFNTNSMWWRLDEMLARLELGDLALPLIVNPKQQAGRSFVQLETAMGAAIGAFPRAKGIVVSRQRFAPVKATCDLLAVRSDVYVSDVLGGLRPNPARDPQWGPPVVVLDSRYYEGVADLDLRFPHVPSLVACRELRIEGDVRFGAGVVLEGVVELINESSVPVAISPQQTLRNCTQRW